MPGSQTSSTIRSTAPRVTPLEAVLAARHRLDGVALVAQHAARARLRTPGSSSTIEDAWASLDRVHAQHGSSIVNRVPRGVLSPTSMLPPCSAMMRRTIARPRPLPRRLVE